MMKKSTFLGVIFLMFCTACSIKGSFQGLYSYYAKTKSKNAQLLIKPDISTPICEIKKSDTPNVYVINGLNLKECIKTTGKAIVYIWAPKCKGEFCYPLNSLQQKCNIKNIELFIVAECYDNELMQINYRISRPIFGIDVEYYKSNMTSRYLAKFIFDLTSKNDIRGRLIYFEDGVFNKSFEAIEGI
jgi:hypothetical protein